MKTKISEIESLITFNIFTRRKDREVSVIFFKYKHHMLDTMKLIKT